MVRELVAKNPEPTKTLAAEGLAGKTQEFCTKKGQSSAGIYLAVHNYCVAHPTGWAEDAAFELSIILSSNTDEPSSRDSNQLPQLILHNDRFCDFPGSLLWD